MSADSFTAQFLEHFRAATAERTQKIHKALKVFAATPGDKATLDELSRELHTLKGEAELMAFKDVALIVRHSESLVAATDKARPPEPKVVAALEDAVRAVSALVSGVGAAQVDVALSVQQLDQVRRELGG